MNDSSCSPAESFESISIVAASTAEEEVVEGGPAAASDLTTTVVLRVGLCFKKTRDGDTS